MTSRTGWQIARFSLVALWVLWAALSWWAQPRAAPVGEARADLAAGRVVAYQWGDRWDNDVDGGWASGPPTLTSRDTLGPIFAWRTAGHSVRYTVLPSPDSEFTLTDAIDKTRFSDPEAASLAEAGAPEFRSGQLYPRLASLAKWGGPLLFLAFLALLINAPAPRLGTKWFWFWVVVWGPFGTGVLFWLFREHPWAARDSPPEAKRDRGHLGFLIGVIAAIAVSFLVYLLHDLLGDALVPTPGNPG